MRKADAVAGGGIVLLGGAEMAHEEIANVGEGGGAARRDLSGGELEVQTTQGVMNAAGMAEIESAVGERQGDVVLGRLSVNVTEAKASVRKNNQGAATAAGLSVKSAATEGGNFWLIAGWHGASFS